MVETSIERDFIEEIHKLDRQQQERVLEFARSLANVQSAGIPGKYLLGFAGTIDKEDLRAMARTIDKGCERVNRNEW